MDNRVEVDENVYRIIKSAIILEEKRNAKSHEKNDAKMVDELCDIIKKEVDRDQR